MKAFVIGVVLAIPLAAQLTPNPKFRETAVVGAFRELNPEVVGFTTIYRAKVSDDEDVAVIRGGDLLGIFVLSRSAPDVAYTITIDVDAGSGRVEALLAGADGVVIRRTGDYGFESPRLRYFFNARTKAYYGRREFAPGHTVIDGGRLVVSDPDPAAYRPDGRGSGVGFGPGGAYSVAAGAPKMYGESGCVVRRGDKMFVVAKGALEDYAAARPKRVELNGMPDVAGLNETIGPWQVVDGRLWFGLTFYDGEGLTGVGGFGWFDTAEEVFDVRRPAEVKKNLTLANSRFVADAIQSAHGVEARVVHPPVPGGFPLVPWDKRQNRVVGIGGFRRDKRWRDAFDVVKQVRERGHDIGLSLIGYRQSPPDWLNELIELQREHASWFKLHVDVPRTELVQIVAASKFGIHCMREEHFGIAVAELVRAGCIPFVHDSGGPPEIGAGEAALRFRSTADAVDRIDAVLRQESLQLRLREALSEHGRQFGVEGFMSSIREIVAQFIADSEGRPGSPAEVQ